MTKKEQFRQIVWGYYHEHHRSMPWREQPTPYYVLVSELMLQQTQVSRVLPKFQQFVHVFPAIESLAAAPLAEVLAQWSGLGYNRRARFLHATAQKVVQQFEGILPHDQASLVALPGIGPNTAGALRAYAFNQPAVFIETNIRTVFLHHFFANETDVTDKQIISLVEATLDAENPREWYWALMDYGTHLKVTQGNNIARSKHYKKQSAFAGSLRQVRGAIVKLLVEAPLTLVQLTDRIKDERTAVAVLALERDGLVERSGELLHLTGQRELP